MIKEKEIEIFISSRNITFYRNKGYEPITQGDTIKVKIEDLNITCKKRVTAVCGCGTETDLRYEKYIINKNRRGYYGCKKCSRKKAIKTSQERYGVNNYMQTEECKKMVAKNNLEKYGVVCNFQVKEIKEKIKKKFLEKYGVENYMLSEEFDEKSKKTCIEKYGVDHFSKTIIFKEQYADNLWNIYTLEKMENYDIKNYKLDLKNRLIILKCEKNHEYSISSKNLYQRTIIYKSNICTICNPIDNNTISDAENEICDFIKDNYNGEIIQSDRNILDGKELDIYLPSLNLAIEFNGIYWHSEIYKDKNYHLNKTVMCEKKGIQLIHIYGDEWKNKKEIVKSNIKNILGKNKKIKSLDCIIKDVELEEVKSFLNENHIQGFTKSKYKIGLYYENKLVSIIIFGRNCKNNKYELIRYCDVSNIEVIGSFRKLLNYFKEKYNVKEIFSYADRSWFHLENNDYEEFGFELIGETKPDYYYIVNREMKNKNKFRKDILVKEGFARNKSEHEIMLDRDYYRIYDSGSLKYKWILD